jgi:predicted acyl esterase
VLRELENIMRTFLISAAALLLPAVALAQSEPIPADVTPYERAATHDGMEKSSLYIPSLDGTRVAVTVYRPTRGGVVETGSLPVIVTQARSDTRPRNLDAIRYFVTRGYVWVAQDRRGTGASFGTETGFVNDDHVRDGEAVIEWAGSQPFSNGKVATLGCSNQGAWQYQVMRHHPRHLVAAAPSCSSPQLFDHGVALNGIPMIPLGAEPYSGECPPDAVAVARPNNDAPQVVPVDADGDGSLLAAARQEQRCRAPMLGQYDSGVHILQIGGWFDAAVAGQLEGQRLWGGRVVMGPWDHGIGMPSSASFPGDTFQVNAEALRWFDHHAKGLGNDPGEPGIVYYTVNADPGTEWRRADNWAAASGAKQTLYLADDALSAERPVAGAASVTYAGQDVELFEGMYSPLGRLWTGDMRATYAQSLVHTMAPLGADLEMTGTPSARLWVSADAADANVFAIIEDVAPDGTSRYVTDGRLRASWRKLATPPWGQSGQLWHRGFAEDIAPLELGKPAELAFDFFPVSYVFKKWHSLRLSIVSSIGEAYQAPPATEGRPVNLTIYRNAEHPSRIEVPVRALAK